MKETFYFSHDYNARDDEKIMNMLADMWTEWYGLYWILIETLAQNDWKIKLESIKWLSYKLRCDNLLITKLVHSYNLFIIDEEEWIFYNRRLLSHLEKRLQSKQKMSEWWKKAMAKRWGDDKVVISEVIRSDNKVKERKGKESKVKEIKHKYGEFKKILLSEKEKNKLIEDYWQVTFDNYIKILDEWIEMKWYKYKNHNLAIRNWINRDKEKWIVISSISNDYEKQKAERLARYGIKDNGF